MPDKKNYEVADNNHDEEIKKIEELISSIKFGSITIHVENGKVIQLDKNEKIRFR